MRSHYHCRFYGATLLLCAICWNVQYLSVSLQALQPLSISQGFENTIDWTTPLDPRAQGARATPQEDRQEQTTVNANSEYSLEDEEPSQTAQLVSQEEEQEGEEEELQEGEEQEEEQEEGGATEQGLGDPAEPPAPPAEEESTSEKQQVEPADLAGLGPGSPSEEATSEAVRPRAPQCENKDAGCAGWKDTGECARNKPFMDSTCPLACDTCLPPRSFWNRCSEAYQQCVRVWLEVALRGEQLGNVTIDLFSSLLPRTAENFRVLSTGEQAKHKGFKGSVFYRVIPGFMIQGGVGASIYGGRFDDEGFPFNHDEPYLVSMANGGPNTNGGQFFITVAPQHHLDHKHVAFGTVVEGMWIVDKVNQAGTPSGSIPVRAEVVRCGEVPWKRLVPEY